MSLIYQLINNYVYSSNISSFSSWFGYLDFTVYCVSESVFI